MSAAEPIRTCLACGRKTDKKSLWRFMVINNRLTRDHTGKAGGRGAYTCDRGECLRKFLNNTKRIARSLRVRICGLADELTKETQE